MVRWDIGVSCSKNQVRRREFRKLSLYVYYWRDCHQGLSRPTSITIRATRSFRGPSFTFVQLSVGLIQIWFLLFLPRIFVAVVVGLLEPTHHAPNNGLKVRLVGSSTESLSKGFGLSFVFSYCSKQSRLFHLSVCSYYGTTLSVCILCKLSVQATLADVANRIGYKVMETVSLATHGTSKLNLINSCP